MFLCPHWQFKVSVWWGVKSRDDLLEGGNETAKQENQQQQEAGGPNPSCYGPEAIC